jgi:hypothetical protein
MVVVVEYENVNVALVPSDGAWGDSSDVRSYDHILGTPGLPDHDPIASDRHRCVPEEQPAGEASGEGERQYGEHHYCNRTAPMLSNDCRLCPNEQCKNGGGRYQPSAGRS